VSKIKQPLNRKETKRRKCNVKKFATSQFEFLCQCKCVPVTFLNFFLCKNATCNTEMLLGKLFFWQLHKHLALNCLESSHKDSCQIANVLRKLTIVIGLLSNNHVCIISDCLQLKHVSLTKNEQPTQTIVRLCMKEMKHFFELLSLTVKKG